MEILYFDDFSNKLDEDLAKRIEGATSKMGVMAKVAKTRLKSIIDKVKKHRNTSKLKMSLIKTQRQYHLGMAKQYKADGDTENYNLALGRAKELATKEREEKTRMNQNINNAKK